MERDELYKEIAMSYNEMVQYLLSKYGKADGDYFCTEECRSRNKKIGRAREGLVCHHIAEDKGGNLSGASEIGRASCRERVS